MRAYLAQQRQSLHASSSRGTQNPGVPDSKLSLSDLSSSAAAPPSTTTFSTTLSPEQERAKGEDRGAWWLCLWLCGACDHGGAFHCLFLFRLCLVLWCGVGSRQLS